MYVLHMLEFTLMLLHELVACQLVVFCLSSFSTDEDNDTEVEAVDMDTELHLVTECWVEPQSGIVMNCMDPHRHFQELKYQEIPQAVCTAFSYTLTYSHTLTYSL